MKTHQVSVPSFLYSQVKQYDDGTVKDHLSCLLDNTKANIESFEASNPEANMISVIVREKIEDGDFKYSIASFPYSKYPDNLVIMNIFGYKKLPTMLLATGHDLLRSVEKVIKRVFGNIAFS